MGRYHEMEVGRTVEREPRMPSGKDDSHGLKLKILLPTAGVSSAASSGV